MRQIWNFVASAVDGRDAMLAIGLAMLAYGVSCVWSPLGLIVPGLVLTAIAIFGVRG
jgi:hypothetical protein